ncbi:hypothetical protein [Streptomyces sp. NPDC048187]|uniref:hypothetical protein n=1 Tax=Streptomyces sp. NPDC048187 TaxID=3365509 RepID=UPI00371C7F91
MESTAVAATELECVMSVCHLRQLATPLAVDLDAQRPSVDDGHDLTGGFGDLALSADAGSGKGSAGMNAAGAESPGGL